uniref:Uncharacterized protein n=1 Tax=Panagrolaimus sp. JU765 TaxID=591449 RepID=A0AC34QTV4_9BILA
MTKNGTDDDRFEIPHIFNVFEDYPWLMWVVLVVISVVILALVIIFCCYIIHNKKKVVRRGSHQALSDFDHPTPRHAFSFCFLSRLFLVVFHAIDQKG